MARRFTEGEEFTRQELIAKATEALNRYSVIEEAAAQIGIARGTIYNGLSGRSKGTLERIIERLYKSELEEAGLRLVRVTSWRVEPIKPEKTDPARRG